MPGRNLDRHRREGLRADILLVLNSARIKGASQNHISEQLIMRTLGDSYDDIGPSELRRELDYLSEKDLIDIEGQGADIWRAALTVEGIDVVEGAADVPAGIAELR